MNYKTLTFFLLLLNITVSAQITISGKVVSAKTGQPLYGVNVLGRGTTEGDITDKEGIFRLKTQAPSIEISYVGYQPMVIDNVADGAILFIQLNPKAYDATDGTIVVVRAVPIPVELQIPAPLMNIPAEHLSRDDRTSIEPALNRVTGLLMHSGALNTNRITIRGIGNRSPFVRQKYELTSTTFLLPQGLAKQL